MPAVARSDRVAVRAPGGCRVSALNSALALMALAAMQPRKPKRGRPRELTSSRYRTLLTTPSRGRPLGAPKQWTDAMERELVVAVDRYKAAHLKKNGKPLTDRAAVLGAIREAQQEMDKGVLEAELLEKYGKYGITPTARRAEIREQSLKAHMKARERKVEAEIQKHALKFLKKLERIRAKKSPG